HPPQSSLFPYTTLFRSDAACQTFTQFFSLGHVVAGEDDSAGAELSRFGQRRERRFDDARAAAMLERHRVCDDRPALQGGVDLLRSEEHTSELQSRGHLV